MHARGEAKRFYQQLVAPVLICKRATGNSQWFMEVEGRFPWLWTPDRKERDLRQLVLRSFRGAPTIG